MDQKEKEEMVKNLRDKVINKIKDEFEVFGDPAVGVEEGAYVLKEGVPMFALGVQVEPVVFLIIMETFACMEEFTERIINETVSKLSAVSSDCQN